MKCLEQSGGEFLSTLVKEECGEVALDYILEGLLLKDVATMCLSRILERQLKYFRETSEMYMRSVVKDSCVPRGNFLDNESEISGGINRGLPQFCKNFCLKSAK